MNRPHCFRGAATFLFVVALARDRGRASCSRPSERRGPSPLNRRCSRWILCGRSRCPTSGSSARRSDCRSIHAITYGSFIVPRPSRTTRRLERSRTAIAVSSVRRSSSSIPTVTSSRRSAGRAPGTSGPIPSMESSSTTKTTSGSAATAPRTVICSSSTGRENSCCRSAAKGRARAATISRTSRWRRIWKSIRRPTS